MSPTLRAAIVANLTRRGAGRLAADHEPARIVDILIDGVLVTGVRVTTDHVWH